LAGGAKKISESSLLDRNRFSISGVVLNEVSSTAGEVAFHTDVLPAKWLKIGLHKTHKQKLSAQQDRPARLTNKYTR
jgi:hypothetical protein